MQDPYAQQKCDQLRKMLDDGLVMLHLDPRPADVIVPPQFKLQPMLRLNLAWGFNLPALDIDEHGVYAVLSFNRVNFGCSIPWSAIFAMTWPDLDHDGYVWPDSAPAELQGAFAAATTVGEDEGRGGPKLAPPLGAPRPVAAQARVQPLEEPKPRPIFIVHEGGRKDDAPAEDPTSAPPPPSEKPRLRLVKG